MIISKLQDGTISREEFAALLFLDRRIYEETAKVRFSSLDTNCNPNHPDFMLRLEVNAHLKEPIGSYVKRNKEYLGKKRKVKVIELGASLGAISSLSVLEELYHAGLIDKVDLTILDICKEPLDKTKAIDFDLLGLYNRANLTIPFGTLKKILENTQVIEGNALDTQQPDDEYTISIAAFTHHHLNIYDKEIACRELERITSNRGIIIVGDLTFSYEEFIKWLGKHQTELNSKGQRVPYAVESFISLQQHQNLFCNSSPIFKKEYPQHYIFAMERK